MPDVFTVLLNKDDDDNDDDDDELSLVKKELWVGKKIRRGDKMVILSNSTPTQIPDHKTSKKKTT